MIRVVCAVLMLLVLGGPVSHAGTSGTPAEPKPMSTDEAVRHATPMAWIKDGSFMMGRQDGISSARPAHSVYLYAFYLDLYEVTASRYATFLEAMGPTHPGLVPMYWDEVQLRFDGTKPVVGVTWEAAAAYCAWNGKRLPSEAEWEKAARGTDGRSYPWGNAAPTTRLANYLASFSGTRMIDNARPVDSDGGGQSPYGVYGMAGNVSEWVADWFDPAYYADSPDSNPTGPAVGTLKVIRGGSFGDTAVELNSASRDSYAPAELGPFVGIRCARDGF